MLQVKFLSESLREAYLHLLTITKSSLKSKRFSLSVNNESLESLLPMLKVFLAEIGVPPISTTKCDLFEIVT